MLVRQQPKERDHYGGGEFLIALGGCSSEYLKHRADRVRTAINGSSFFTKHGSRRSLIDHRRRFGSW
jgi:GGDEF domain-containing protein